MKKHSCGEYIKLIFKIDKRFIFMLLMEIISNLFYYLVPVGIVTYLGTIYQNNPTKDGYKFILIACAIFTIARMTISALNIYIFSIINDRIYRYINYYVLNTLYKKIETIDYDTYQSSDFLNNYQKAANDSADEMFNTFWNASQILSSLVSLMGLGTIFTLINPLIIVYSVVIGVICYFIFSLIAKIWYKLSEKNRQKVRERAYVKRIFFLKDSSIDIKTSKLSQMYLNKNNEIGDQIIRNIDKYSTKRVFLSSLCKILMRSIFVMCLAFTAYTTIKEKNIIILASLITASTSLTDIISTLSNSIAGFRETVVYRHDYYRVIDTLNEIETTGKTFEEELKEFKTLEFQNVTFKYPKNEQNTIIDLNLKINEKDKIAIVGENGAGKTSFIKLLLRLYDPINGSIYINEINYKDILPKKIRQQFVCVFQNYQIFAGTVAENVLLRKCENEQDEELVKMALSKVGLISKIESLEKGIHTICTKEFDKDGIELSGGERQKLVIARIFASNAPVLVLDEPNSALDPIAEKKIFEEIFDYSINKTLIFISHRFSTTIRADRIYLFNNGKIEESGTHQELMNIESGNYRRMFLIQAEEYRKVDD